MEKEYDNKAYTGATPIDSKAIHLAITSGKKLTIDNDGRIYDSSGRYIADGKERSV